MLVLESPAGTEVELLHPQSDNVDGIQLLWSDNAPYPGTFQTAYNLDWPECDCRVHPVPDFLADFAGEGVEGDWSLRVESLDSSDGGILQEWCIRLFGACGEPAPELLAELEDGEVTLEWESESDFDQFEIVRDGIVIATLEDDFDSYVDSTPGVGLRTYSVVGVDAESCRIASLKSTIAIGAFEDCHEIDLDSDAREIVDEISFEERFVVDQVELDVTYLAIRQDSASTPTTE